MYISKFTVPRQSKEGFNDSNKVMHIKSLVLETLKEHLVLWLGS
jgi:hypothetical protein